MTRRSERTVPNELPTLTVAVAPVDSWMPIHCGSTIAEGTLYLVGGRGSNFIMKTKDGQRFTEIKSKGRGLRGVVVEGKRMWVSGEYGFIGYSDAGGRSFTRIDTDVDACLHALARGPDGTLWVGGDGGYLARVNQDEVRRVKGIGKIILRLQHTSSGLLCSSAAGLYTIEDGRPRRLLSKPVGEVLVTANGTLLAVGANGTIFRSENGTTFKRAKVPPFKPVRIARAKQMSKAFWERIGRAYQSIDQMADGRIVVGGEQGALVVSSDDGATFRPLAQKVTDGKFNVVRSFGGTLVLAGDHGVIMTAH